MRIKRILTTLLVALMMFSLVAFASAADNTDSTFKVDAKVNPAAALLGDEDVFKIKPGSGVELTAEVVENTGATKITMYFYYDAEILEYQGYVNGELFTEGKGHTVNVTEGNGFIIVKYEDPSEVGVKLAGALGTAKFALKAGYHGDLTSEKLYVKGSYFDEATLGSGKFDTSVEMRTYKIHNYGAPVEVEPTCVENGKATYNCSCGNVYETVLEATGSHTHGEPVVENNVLPTCTDAGSYENVVYCTVCEEELSRTTVTVDALDHTWTDATCTTPKTCSVCGATEGDPIAHTWTDATCTTPKTCSVCGETEGEALGHKWTDATCTVAKTCSVCQETEGDPLGHLNDIVLEKVEPTCTATGLTAGIKCSRCNVDTVPQTEIPMNPHHYEEAKYKAPTCTENGWAASGHLACVECGADAPDVPPVILATGHNKTYSPISNDYYDIDPIIKEENRVEPTCIANGSYDSVVYCATCEVEVSRTNIVIPMLNHAIVDDPRVEPTCTETGLTFGQHCTRCDVVPLPQQVIPALGHKNDIVLKAVEPGCLTTGLTEGVQCSVCQTITTAQEVIAAKGHTSVDDEYKAPTCTETGLSGGTHCSVCNEHLVEADVIPALGHKWVDATCTAPKTCSVCQTTEGAALGHTEVVDAAVAPTCTETGLTEGKHCSVCNEVLKAQETVAALGHTEEALAAVEATCTETGLTAGTKCSVCETILVAQEVVAAKGHTPKVDEAVAPTCTTTGLTAGSHCEVCNYVIKAQEEVAALGHTEVVDAAVAPTTSATGLTEGKHCSVCNEVLVAQNTIKKLPVVVTAPTETWEKGDGDMIFKSDADFADFESVTVNGEVLAAENYTVKEGSTVVTLSEKYLKTLENGTYTICIKSTSGTAESTFTIENSSGWIVAVIIIAAVVVCAGVVVGVVFYKKKKATGK